MTDLAKYLGTFLRVYLPRERGASVHTCEAYANSFKLLLCFAAEQFRVRPSNLKIEQIDATLILAFLEHIENNRGNSARTRNARLAAIHSFFRYLEYRHPPSIDQSRQIHAIPMKRCDKALVAHLTRDEMQALLDAPELDAASGVRDRAMLHLTYAAGLRVSELVSLRLDQFDSRVPASIHVIGKGRRERMLPLWKGTARGLKAWLNIRRTDGDPELFHNAAGRAMTRAGFEYILAKHVVTAAGKQPSIGKKRVTPHVLRHTCAMHTLQATGDVRKVSLWLGHANIQSTEMYLRADPTEKLEALTKMSHPTMRRGQFKAPDKLLAMLKATGHPG